MKLLGKGSKLYSMFLAKCPVCHEGDLFTSKAYDLKNFSDMHENCSHCGQKYQIEPSFFEGAMYVSYGMQVALLVTVFVGSKMLFDKVNPLYAMAFVIALALLLLPITFRHSRSIWINFFMSYDEEIVARKVEK